MGLGGSWMRRGSLESPRILSKECHFTRIMLAALRKSPGGPDGWDKVNGMLVDGLHHETAFAMRGPFWTMATALSKTDQNPCLLGAHALAQRVRQRRHEPMNKVISNTSKYFKDS